jgi:hypothetical protein
MNSESIVRIVPSLLLVLLSLQPTTLTHLQLHHSANTDNSLLIHRAMMTSVPKRLPSPLPARFSPQPTPTHPLTLPPSISP